MELSFADSPFDIVGFKNPVAVGTVLAVVNWVFKILSIVLIGRIGHCRILLWTIWGMPVCLILAAISFKWVPIDQKTLQLTDDRISWPGTLVLVARTGFIAFYAAGLGS
jgi:SP family myo-inositol transporter-like MFS transporter 13